MKYVITENQYKFLKGRRNLEKLPNYIRATYKWLNPKAFKDFEEFLNRVVFSATRDFIWEYTDESDDYESLTIEFMKTVKKTIMDEYYSEILEYYNSHP